MAIASMIVQVAQRNLDRVAGELAGMAGVTVHTITPKQEIIITVEASTLDGVSHIARQIETIGGVTGVFPAYITTADAEEIPVRP